MEGIYAVIFTVAILLLFAVGMFCFGFIPIKKRWKIRKYGEEAIAEIESSHYHYNSSVTSPDHTSHSSYGYTIKFKDNTGATHATSLGIYTQRRMPNGKKIRIKFDPEKPSNLVAIDLFAGNMLYFLQWLMIGVSGFLVWLSILLVTSYILDPNMFSL